MSQVAEGALRVRLLHVWTFIFLGSFDQYRCQHSNVRHTHIYTYIYLHTCMRTYIHVTCAMASDAKNCSWVIQLRIRMSPATCIYTYVCMCLYAYVYMYLYASNTHVTCNMDIYVCMYACMYVCVCLRSQKRILCAVQNMNCVRVYVCANYKIYYQSCGYAYIPRYIHMYTDAYSNTHD